MKIHRLNFNSWGIRCFEKGGSWYCNLNDLEIMFGCLIEQSIREGGASEVILHKEQIYLSERLVVVFAKEMASDFIHRFMFEIKALKNSILIT